MSIKERSRPMLISLRKPSVDHSTESRIVFTDVGHINGQGRSQNLIEIFYTSLRIAAQRKHSSQNVMYQQSNPLHLNRQSPRFTQVPLLPHARTVTKHQSHKHIGKGSTTSCTLCETPTHLHNFPSWLTPPQPRKAKKNCPLVDRTPPPMNTSVQSTTKITGWERQVLHRLGHCRDPRFRKSPDGYLQSSRIIATFRLLLLFLFSINFLHYWTRTTVALQTNFKTDKPKRRISLLFLSRIFFVSSRSISRSTLSPHTNRASFQEVVLFYVVFKIFNILTTFSDRSVYSIY